MRHHLKTVAENNRIDPVKFTEVATEPKASNKFGVCEEGHGYFTVSSWYCDELVAHVKSVLANGKDDNAESKWNSEADGYNQWNSLGGDERAELSAAFISANAED